MTLNAPQEFKGSAEAREANFDSHRFDREAARCIDCDCRPWGRVCYWPCGAVVPREQLSGTEAVHAMAQFHFGAGAYDQERNR